MQHREHNSKKVSLAVVLSDMAKSGIVGGINVTVVTPIMNFMNRLNVTGNNKALAEKGTKIAKLPPFTLRRAFDGVISYNSSVYPMVGVSIGLQRALANSVNLLNNKKHNDLLLSIVSGAAGGFVGTLPEGIAQAQQLSRVKPSALNLLKKTYRYNGFTKMNRGALAVMLRQSIFTAGYLGLMPIADKANQENITSNKHAASALAAICSGAIVGPATAPFNNLRFHKQYEMHRNHQARSYSNIFKQLVAENGIRGLFNTWKPRTFMSGIAMYMLHEGKKIYDELTDDIDHDNDSSSEVKIK